MWTVEAMQMLVVVEFSHYQTLVLSKNVKLKPKISKKILMLG